MVNRFWRNTLTEKHRPDGDDPLNTDPPARVPPTPVGKRFRCVGCGCTMTANGEDIWSLGDGYKEWKDSSAKHAKAIEKKDEEIQALQRELNAVKTERDALRGSPTPSAGRRVGALVE